MHLPHNPPMTIKSIQLRTPYLLFMGDVPDDGHAKTGHGIAYWRPELCAGQMRLPGCAVDMGLPEMDVDAALKAGVGTAIICIASTGGVLLDVWIPALAGLARAGIDIAAGTHAKINDNAELVAAAQEGGARLIDVRVPPAGIQVGRGRPRPGKRVLMVGTDCAVGKKYSALALHREFEARGIKSDFRATGQTGIMIAGEGMPIDAVVSDFVSGAAEILSPDNDADHWDVIEGQGALLHPSYAGVSLGLLHGSQPDAVILCHDAGREDLLGLEDLFEVPPLDEAIDIVLTSARVTNPKCIWAGISVNTSSMGDEQRRGYLADIGGKYGLPCVDPVATGMADIADYLLENVK
jgi:uncharacterized NAD-dependent epimerase/dehydratase family protein